MELTIITPAPLQLGNLVTFRVRFVDEAGAPVDVSAATAVHLKFEDPTGVVAIVTAAKESDGTDGWIVAAYAPAAFGQWRLQGRATIAAADKHTARAVFTVEPNIPDA